MSERDEENEFAAWLKANGHDSARLQLPGQRGWPDRIVWLSDGRTIYVEMKKPGGKLSLHQEKWRDRLQETNQNWAACWSAEEAIAFIKDLL